MSGSEQTRSNDLALRLVVFLAGGALMALEIVGSRILAPSFGSSIFVWGSLIGVFLVSLAMGYEVGGRVADRAPSARALAVLLAVASGFVTLSVAIADGAIALIVRHAPGPRLGPFLAAFVLFAPPGALMGTVAPFAVRLRARSLEKLGATTGSLYATSTAGSIAGTFLAAFWLVPAVGTRRVVLAIAMVVLLASAVSMIALAKIGRRFFVAASAVLLGVQVVMLASSTEPWSPKLATKTEHASLDDVKGIRESFDSRYHRISIVDEPEKSLRFLLFDRHAQGAARLVGDKVDMSIPVLPYFEAVDLLPRYRPGFDSALVVGLGVGYAPGRLRASRSESEVDVVEIDPSVVDVARRWFDFDASGARVHVADGRTWIAEQKGSFDVVFLDAYHADAIPFHLTTIEFLELVRRRLKPSGIVAMNVIGAIDGKQSGFFRALYKTFATVFPEARVHPIGRLPWEKQNVFLIGSREPLEALDDATTAKWPRYQPAIRTDDVPTLTDDRAPVDALLSVSN